MKNTHLPIPQIIIDLSRKADRERLQENNAKENLKNFLDYEDNLKEVNG